MESGQPIGIVVMAVFIAGLLFERVKSGGEVSGVSVKELEKFGFASMPEVSQPADWPEGEFLALTK